MTSEIKTDVVPPTSTTIDAGTLPITSISTPAPAPITYVINQAPAKKERKEEECEYCHKMFSIQGIDSHRRLKHGVKKGGEKAKIVETRAKENVKPEPEVSDMPEEGLSDRGVVIDKPLKNKEHVPKEDVPKEDIELEDFDDFEDDEYEDDEEEKEDAGLGVLPVIIAAAVLGIIAFLLYNFILKRPQVQQKVEDFSQGANAEPLQQQPMQQLEQVSQEAAQPTPSPQPQAAPQEQPSGIPGFFRPPQPPQVPMPPRQKKLVLLGKQQ